MITVGTRSCIGNQLYDYQGELAPKSRNRTEALADNQAFASRLFQAMDRKNQKEEPAKEAAAEPQAVQYTDDELDGMAEGTVLSYILKMREHMRDICGKVMTGSAEPSFQIGSSTFTEKEWEEFLSRFDSVEEAIQAAMRAEYEEDGDTAAVKTNAAGTSIANDRKKAQAVLDPAVAVTKPFAAGTARQALPPGEASAKMEQAEKETAASAYYQMLWKGRISSL